MSVPDHIIKAFEKLGRTSTFVQFQSELLARVQDDSGNYEEFLRDFRKLETNVERVNLLYDRLQQYHLLEDKFTEDGKDDRKAKKHKEKGDKWFGMGRFSRALQSYTRSVMKAKSSESLAMAYANRSAALFKLELFDECLADVERALAGDYPDHLKPSLVQRRARLLTRVGASAPLFNFYETIPQIPENETHLSIPSAKACLEVNLDEKNRTRISASRRIEIGEVVAVEKPFTFTLVAAELYHCHHCYELCYDPIPCESCSQSVYCSETCQQNAQATYHQYECPILISLKNIVGKHKAFILAIKMSFLINEEPEASDVYSLAKNMSDKNSSDELFTTALVTALMYHLVKNYTRKFAEGEEEAENKFKDLLVTHLRICIYHGSGIDELCPNLTPDDKVLEGELLGFKTQSVGCALYPFYGLIRHSCCPNVIAHHHGTTRVLRTIRTIPKGKECFVSYGPHYVQHGKQERQNRLFSQYHFTCKCRACEENWPQLDLNPYYLTSAEDLMFVTKIRDGNVAIAGEGIPVLINRLKQLEMFEPLSNLTLQQRLLSYCYDIFGNKRRVL